MAKEIERKFLVDNDSYKSVAVRRHEIAQGYISRRKEGTVRVRIRDGEAFLTVKGVTRGVSRSEWEYPVPASDAREMLAEVCEGGVLEKTRWIVEHGGYTWEVDEFHGPLAPLTVAEVELPSADTNPPLPPFVGKEVSDDPAYFNSSLISRLGQVAGNKDFS